MVVGVRRLGFLCVALGARVWGVCVVEVVFLSHRVPIFIIHIQSLSFLCAHMAFKEGECLLIRCKRIYNF
jgi:hypothetical protein